MARFGKTIQIIDKLVEKAMSKGAGAEVWTKRNGIKVYEVHISEEGRHIALVHYGTTTLIYDMEEKIIIHNRGYSNSDRDSVNTFLDSVREPTGAYFRYGSEMGWTEVSDYSQAN